MQNFIRFEMLQHGKRFNSFKELESYISSGIERLRTKEPGKSFNNFQEYIESCLDYCKCFVLESEIKHVDISATLGGNAFVDIVTKNSEPEKTIRIVLEDDYFNANCISQFVPFFIDKAVPIVENVNPLPKNCKLTHGQLYYQIMDLGLDEVGPTIAQFGLTDVNQAILNILTLFSNDLHIKRFLTECQSAFNQFSLFPPDFRESFNLDFTYNKIQNKICFYFRSNPNSKTSFVKTYYFNAEKVGFVDVSSKMPVVFDMSSKFSAFFEDAVDIIGKNMVKF